MNNATRISWIDSAEVADLLRQLEGPVASPPPGAWELHTLPSQLAEPPVSLIPSLAPSPTPDLAPATAPSLEPSEPAANLGLEPPTPPDVGPTQIDPSTALELHAPAPTPSPAPAPVSAPPPAAPRADLPALQPPPQPSSPLPTSADGDSEIQRIRHQLRELRQRAQQAGMFSAAIPSPAALAPAPVSAPPPETPPPAPPPVQPLPEPARVAPDASHTYFTIAEVPSQQLSISGFAPPAAGLSDRLAALHSWVMQQTGSAEVQLINDVGEVLHGASERSSWIISTLMASQAQIRVNLGAPVTSESRFIHRELAPGRVLTLIPVASCYGQVTVAVLQDQPLPAEISQRIESAVKSATDYQLPPQ